MLGTCVLSTEDSRKLKINLTSFGKTIMLGKQCLHPKPLYHAAIDNQNFKDQLNQSQKFSGEKKNNNNNRIGHFWENKAEVQF